MRLIVTGASGVLGSELIRQTMETAPQTEIVAVARQTAQLPQQWHESGHVACRSWAELAAMELADGDVVVHCAFPRKEDGQALTEALTLTASLLKKVGTSGKRVAVVGISSRSVYGQNPETPWRETTPPMPNAPYALAKMAQELLIRGFSNTELKEVLDELYLDDAVDIVEEMPASVVIRILDKATPEMRKSINEILKYPEDSAGSIMNMEFLSLKKDMTVEDAFKRIRRIGGELETINILYVTDPTRHLQGVLSVRDLLLADEDDRIEDIMDPNVVSVTTLDDKEDVAQAMSKYDYLAMPVVDQENRLVGIVTVDDAMDVMEDEATEDMEKMAAMLPSEHPYMRSTPIEIWKNRIPINCSSFP